MQVQPEKPVLDAQTNVLYGSAMTRRFINPNQGHRRLWVLGASLGGPAAVKEFLDNLPRNLPETCFLLAQHIDANFINSLREMLDGHAGLKAEVVSGPMSMQPGHIYIVPVHRRLRILSSGLLAFAEDNWSAPYSPNIDQVFTDAAMAFGNEVGAIVFSGMDEDGAEGCVRLAEAGAPVWVQSPETCGAASMPGAVMARVKTEFCGSPAELALKFDQVSGDDAVKPNQQPGISS